MTSPQRIHFQLDEDADGYPPVAVESVWATPGSKSNEYVLDSIPFFTREATNGDMVKVLKKEGRFWFESIVKSSNNSLMRVVFFDRGCVEKIRGQLVDLGCSTEYLEIHNLMSVDIPIEVDLTAVQKYLEAEVANGRIDYEEPILRQ